MEQKTTNYSTRDLQIKSLGLLKCIDKVCEEHGIQYYLIGGTLLGACRGEGFIPWDDDMDIALMRKDYDLLMEHADEWLPKPYYIVNHKNTPHYPKYFAKIENTDTTLVENFSLGYAGGIYMDIFPLDDVPENPILRGIHWGIFQLLRRNLYFVYRDPYKHGKWAKSWIPRLAQWLFTTQKAHDMMQNVLLRYKDSNSPYVMTHDDGFRSFRKADFSQPIRLNFEGFPAVCPNDTHHVLSQIYGEDYMTPPPPEKRESHCHDYCDFDTPYRTVNFNQLKKQVKGN